MKLPHIEIPEINSKFLIDTGSSRSFISPAKANKYFSDYKYIEPFTVISTHAQSMHNEIIYIPLLKTFKSTLRHKFYIYDIDGRYDGLIGSDLLKKLGANIDMRDQKLVTYNTQIPIIYNPPYEIHLEPRSETRVKIPTNLQNGEAILDYLKFQEGVRMPSALVKCENYLADTIIQNTTNGKIVITIKEPFHVTIFENEVCELNFMKNDIMIDEILKENLNKLRTDHMNNEERHSILSLCHEYRDIFYSDKLPLTFSNQVKHHIRTTNEDPIYIRPYRQPPLVNQEIQNQVDKLLADNVIRESHSPWSAPVHLVPKKLDASGERKHRMVIDYRRLNEITVDDKYPLPNITDLFDKIGRAQYFSTIDLASGYHQIEINEADIPKTAFTTQSGHYEFTRMPFGLKTAPATFQRAMDNVLRGLQGIHCLVYLDDIIIYSCSLEEHLDKLRKIFDRLRETNLKVTLDKCEFLRKEVLYLGHTITKNGLLPNNDKIKAVLNFPIPRTATEIKSFLGLIGYYRKFIKDFAKLTQPLTSCLKKKNKIDFTKQEYIDAFEKCKELLVNAPILQFPDFTKPFVLTTDASNFAIGAVLSQGPIGSDKPIAYASRTLNDAETRYSTIEKELLAIVWATKHFRPYLYGRKFLIYTDHRPLTWIKSIKEPNSKLTRWKLRLAEFDYDIKHKDGKQNCNADALSRIRLNALHDKDSTSMIVNVDERERELQRYIQSLTNEILQLNKVQNNSPHSSVPRERTPSPMAISLPLERSNQSVDARSIHSSLSAGSATATAGSTTESASEGREESIGTVHSADDLDTDGMFILQEAIDTKPNQIIVHSWNRDELTVKDLSRNKQKILDIYLPLNNIELIKRFLKSYTRPKIKYFFYFHDPLHRKQFSEAIISLFQKGTVKFYECTKRVTYVRDETQQREAVLKYHEGKNSHRGIKETLIHLKRNLYWENMDQTVSSIINSCDICKKMKYDRRPLKPEIQLSQTQTKPFQELFIDTFSIDGKQYLTIVDAFSKLGQAFEISSKSAPEIVRALVKFFSVYGVPGRISADPGAEFNNTLLKEMLIFYKIELHIGTAHNPNSMGIVERFHSTILEIYRIAKYEQKVTDAASIMTYAIMAYNHTIHSTTGLTPFEVVFGHTESNNPFCTDFTKQYTQQLVKEHLKRTKHLYKYLTDKIIGKKQTVIEKRGGEKEFDVDIGDTVFIKGVNNRRSKDKPRYQKAHVTGPVERNVVPVITRNRITKIPIKDIRRPPQVLSAGGSNDPMPGPSSAAD